MERRVGRVRIDASTFGELFDFKGAVIWGVSIDEFNIISLLIEHPDMPVIREGDKMVDVAVSLTTTYAENGGITKIERVQPPKLEAIDG